MVRKTTKGKEDTYFSGGVKLTVQENNHTRVVRGNGFLELLGETQVELSDKGYTTPLSCSNCDMPLVFSKTTRGLEVCFCTRCSYPDQIVEITSENLDQLINACNSHGAVNFQQALIAIRQAEGL